MKQQIIVSGIGGQGVLFVTRVIAQVGVNSGIPVLTSETHGMAQRGGTVLSCVKVGNFASPLIRTGQADLGLILWDANLEVHQNLLRPAGALVINSQHEGDGIRLDATTMARELGNAVLTNLVLLGAAVRHQAIFCAQKQCEEAIRQLAPAPFVEQNIAALHLGLNA
ncbi:MAG: 2-oxoacid:acceptor oxidoreductase family protein [Desulfuromonas sp.]